MMKLIKDVFALIVAVIEVLLVFRFVLKLLAANEAAGFVSWIYEASQPLLAPFVFAFPTASVRGGFALEFTTLFAIFAYAFGGYIIEEILSLLDRPLKKNETSN
jgi:hypothetical protein